MFDEEEIEFMREAVGLNLDFDNLSDDDYIEIEDKVGDYYSGEVQLHEDNHTTHEKKYMNEMRIIDYILQKLSEI